MKPRTLRERRLVREALLLLEATAPSALAKWHKGLTYGKKKDMSNAALGTITEFVCIWYVEQSMTNKLTKEIRVNAGADNGLTGKQKKKISSGKSGLIKRLEEYAAQYTEKVFKIAWDQGLNQGRQVYQTFEEIDKAIGKKKEINKIKMLTADEKKALGVPKPKVKISILGLGESASIVDAVLTGQEDCQIQFSSTKKGDTQDIVTGYDSKTVKKKKVKVPIKKKVQKIIGSLGYSNKAGGSSPAQLNKTPVSVGMIDSKDLADAITDNAADIGVDCYDNYCSINGEVNPMDMKKEELEKFMKALPGCFDKKGGKVTLGEAWYDGTDYQKFWIACLDHEIKKLYGAGKTYEHLFTKAGNNFEKVSGDDFLGAIRARRGSPITSLSSCCTTVLGKLAAEVMMEAMDDTLTDKNKLFDLIFLGNGSSSIFKTMYPVPYAAVKAGISKGTKRHQIASMAKAEIEKMDGRYFAVKGGDTDEPQDFKAIHGGFRAMIDDIAAAGAKADLNKLEVKKKKTSNAMTFVYDGKVIFSITARKDQSARMALTKASIELSKDGVAWQDVKNTTKGVNELEQEEDDKPNDIKKDLIGKDGSCKTAAHISDEDKGGDKVPLKNEPFKPDEPAKEEPLKKLDIDKSALSKAFSDALGDLPKTSKKGASYASVFKLLQDMGGGTVEGYGGKLSTASNSFLGRCDTESLKAAFGAISSMKAGEQLSIGPIEDMQSDAEYTIVVTPTEEMIAAVKQALAKKEEGVWAMNGFNKLISETIRIVEALEDEEDTTFIDTSEIDGETLFKAILNFDPDIEVYADGEEQAEVSEEIIESRWLKLAGILID